MLLKLRSKLEGIDVRLYMLSFVFPPVMLELIELLESAQDIVRRCLRFSPFPDDRLVLLLLRNLIGDSSCCAKFRSNVLFEQSMYQMYINRLNSRAS